MNQEKMNCCELTDKDILMDVLSSLKGLSTLFGTALQEASNDHLYQSIEEESAKICNLQREVYYTLYQEGWYTLEKAPQAKINSTITKYDKTKKELA